MSDLSPLCAPKQTFAALNLWVETLRTGLRTMEVSLLIRDIFDLSDSGS
jgi:hypothetical protein